MKLYTTKLTTTLRTMRGTIYKIFATRTSCGKASTQNTRRSRTDGEWASAENRRSTSLHQLHAQHPSFSLNLKWSYSLPSAIPIHGRTLRAHTSLANPFRVVHCPPTFHPSSMSLDAHNERRKMQITRVLSQVLHAHKLFKRKLNLMCHKTYINVIFALTGKCVARLNDWRRIVADI